MLAWRKWGFLLSSMPKHTRAHTCVCAIFFSCTKQWGKEMAIDLVTRFQIIFVQEKKYYCSNYYCILLFYFWLKWKHKHQHHHRVCCACRSGTGQGHNKYIFHVSKAKRSKKKWFLPDDVSPQSTWHTKKKSSSNYKAAHKYMIIIIISSNNTSKHSLH